MDGFDIAVEASQSSKIAGSLTFLLSGASITFNFYEPGYIPISWISTMHILLLSNIAGTVWLAFRYRKVMHITDQTCPKCKSRMAASELKCLNERKKDCNYFVKL